MAVAVIMQFQGGTTEHYDQVIEKMGFKPGGEGPRGALFHWATQTPEGLQVTDVWESRDQFQEFADSQIGPLSAEVGIPGPPQVTFHEVHSYMTAG